MDHWVNESRRVLERSPTCALPLTGLVEELCRAGMDLRGRMPWLLTALEGRKDLFRILREPGGPWARCGLQDWPPASHRDPWILLRAPVESYGEEAPVHRKVREGVLAWGGSMEVDSPRKVARWVRVNREGGRVCRYFVTGRGKSA